eukprot:4997745-Pyramimonas_sp.AAC.1
MQLTLRAQHQIDMTQHYLASTCMDAPEGCSVQSDASARRSRGGQLRHYDWAHSGAAPQSSRALK